MPGTDLSPGDIRANKDTLYWFLQVYIVMEGNRPQAHQCENWYSMHVSIRCGEK